MPSEVILPRVDMDMSTGKISKWFVEPGAAVKKGQPLFEIETDKAAMEIEAPASGTIRDLASASGEDIPVGSVVAWIFAEGEAPVAAFKLATQAETMKGGRASVSVAEHHFDSALPPPMHDASAAERPGDVAPHVAERPRATPMARRLARAHGLDLATLKGSGPRGRIQAGDVHGATGRKPAPTQTASAGTMAAAAMVSWPPPLQAPPPPAAPMARPPAPSPQLAPAPAPAIPAAAGPLNLVRLRDGDGRPTLLVHGFGADVNNWRPLLAGNPSGRPIYAVDLPGHGGSPLGTVVDFVSLVDAVEAGLASSGLGALDLVGHSLGGAVSASLAARAMLDIRSLFLLSPAGLGPDINGAFIRGFLGATTEASLTPWMHELVADPAAITPAFVRATLKAREGTDLVATQAHVARAVFPDDTQAFSIRPDLARLGLPTRILFGGADKIIPARHATDLPPLVALHRLAHVGHMPHIEAREIVAAIHAQTM